MTKICRKCGLEKPLSEFHKDSKMKDGHKNICKACRNKPKKINKHKILDRNIKLSIYRAIKENKRGRLWEKILGYTLDDLKTHLEKQFLPGMNWENYGKVWWIDRIIPLSAYDYTNNNNEFKKAWSLKNCRPLYKIEAIKKRDKIIPSLIKRYNLYDILPVGVINVKVV